MATSSESSVAVAPDSTGKAIRNIAVTTAINGVQTTVQMQVIALADGEGNPISLTSDRQLMQNIALEGRLQTEILLRLLKAADPVAETSRDELLEELAANPDDQDEAQGEN